MATDAPPAAAGGSTDDIDRRLQEAQDSITKVESKIQKAEIALGGGEKYLNMTGSDPSQHPQLMDILKALLKDKEQLRDEKASLVAMQRQQIAGEPLMPLDNSR